jgi:hypothetical protein
VTDNKDWYEHTTGGGSGSRILMTLKTMFNVRRTLQFQDPQTLMLAFTIIKASNDYLESGVPWEEPHPVATGCVLYLCANAYNATSKNGVLNEQVVGSWAIKDPASHGTVNSSKEGPDETRMGPDAYDLCDPTYDDVPKHDLRLLIPLEQSEDFSSAMMREVNVSHVLLRSTIDYLHQFAGLEELVAFPDQKSPEVLDALWNSTNLTSTF